MARAAKAPPSDRAAYLVVGMHRSGTSALTQLLALAGAQLPANVMPGDEHNEKGYFEPWKIAIFNDERLHAAGSAWHDPFAFPFRPLPQAEERGWLDRAKSLFEEEFAGVARPLMKDPRATVLMPFWREVLAELGVATRAVAPVRHPLAVAGSLARRDGFPAQKSVLVWSAYMLAAEAYTRDMPRAFVSYEALLADWRGEVARIEAAHGAALPNLTPASEEAIDRFLTPDLRHNTGGGGLEGLGWAGEVAQAVFGWFEAAATGGDPDRAPLDQAARDLARRADEIGALVSPATRDLDTARAELLNVRRDLEAERGFREALRAEMQRERAELEAGWKADIRRWEAEVERERLRTLEVSEAHQAALALAREASAELDRALSDD